LSLYGDFLASADSMAWSDHARHRQAPSQPGCTHGHCGNCPREAGAWLISKVPPRIHPAMRGLPWLAPLRPAGGQHVQLPLVPPARRGRVA
jgi:hypothetical protein